MFYLCVPVLASALWVGGSAVGLLLAVVFLIPLIRRKLPSRPIEDFTEPEAFTEKTTNPRD